MCLPTVKYNSLTVLFLKFLTQKVQKLPKNSQTLCYWKVIPEIQSLNAGDLVDWHCLVEILLLNLLYVDYDAGLLLVPRAGGRLPCRQVLRSGLLAVEVVVVVLSPDCGVLWRGKNLLDKNKCYNDVSWKFLVICTLYSISDIIIFRRQNAYTIGILEEFFFY